MLFVARIEHRLEKIHETISAADILRRAAPRTIDEGRMTGMARCGRCGRMMQVFYQGGGSDRSYRYQCRGSSQLHGLCTGIGGLRIDRAVATRIP